MNDATETTIRGATIPTHARAHVRVLLELAQTAIMKPDSDAAP